uniref:SFRICE_012272 n=1 Tax=Spodoptera frugiperda TaxID=7108 RepID=A0A2H1VN12_SPOFR
MFYEMLQAILRRSGSGRTLFADPDTQCGIFIFFHLAQGTDLHDSTNSVTLGVNNPCSLYEFVIAMTSSTCFSNSVRRVPVETLSFSLVTISKVSINCDFTGQRHSYEIPSRGAADYLAGLPGLRLEKQEKERERELNSSSSIEGSP